MASSRWRAEGKACWRAAVAECSFTLQYTLKHLSLWLLWMESEESDSLQYWKALTMNEQCLWALNEGPAGARGQFLIYMTFHQSFLKWSCLIYSSCLFLPFINDTSGKKNKACDISITVGVFDIFFFFIDADDNEQKTKHLTSFCSRMLSNTYTTDLISNFHFHL